MKETRPAKASNFQLCTIINIVLLFVILILVARTVLLPQSLVFDAHLAQSNELKKLVRETSQLLKDLAAANVNLPQNIQSDIKNIEQDFPDESTDTGSFLMRSGLIGMGNVSPQPSRLMLQKLQWDLQNCTHGADAAQQALRQCLASSERVAGVECGAMPAAIGDKRWLVIGIPTVSRPNNEDYLLQTLAAMASAFPDSPQDAMYGRVLVVVVNVQSNELDSRPHTRFEEAKKFYSAESGHTKSIYFRFIEADQSEVSLSLDLKKPTIGRDLGSANVPGRMVRKQTRDLALVLTYSAHIGHYYMFLEDDMRFCPGALVSFQYLLSKASEYHPNWLAIRASYGMNGVFLHDKDVVPFADYLTRNQIRRPPDHLVVEWYAGETPESKEYKGARVNVGFRYNLFDHLGVSSSLRTQKQSSFPRCYDLLSVPTVFEVEAFNPQSCPHDDVWPCDHIEPARQSRLDWSSLSKRHY